MLSGYELLLDAIARFRRRDIDFDEIRQWIVGYAGRVGDALDYNGDLYIATDNWVEFVTYVYSEDDRYELGCSLCLFFEKAIMEEPRPLKLPLSDRVVSEYLNVDRGGP